MPFEVGQRGPWARELIRAFSSMLSDHHSGHFVASRRVGRVLPRLQRWSQAVSSSFSSASSPEKLDELERKVVERRGPFERFHCPDACVLSEDGIVGVRFVDVLPGTILR